MGIFDSIFLRKFLRISYLLHTVPTEASFFNRNVLDSNNSFSVRNTVRTEGSDGERRGGGREGRRKKREALR
jgi:hypothetical protein